MEKSLFEQMGGTYHQEGGYLIANLVPPEAAPIGIWGQRRRKYLREYRNPIYTSLFLSGKLDSHLADINQQAEDMFSQLVEQMAAQEGITEPLKADKQIEWVKLYNQGTMTFYAHENVENLGVYIFSCSFTRALICGKIIINDVVSVQPQKEIEMKTTDINKVRYTNRWRIVYGICNN